MILWKNTFITRIIMLIINLVLVLFISIIIYNTTGRICDNNMARDFIEKIKYVPTIPWKVPVYSSILLILLFLSVIFRERLLKNNKVMVYALCVLDILCCVGIMYFLNMGYKGILLIAMANIIIYIEDKRKRTIFIVAAIILYILLDYDIISIKTNMFSINDYFNYYTATQRLYIFSIKNILNSINEIIFILFMVQVIQGQIDENNKINELYSELYKTAEELKVINIQLQGYAGKSEEMAKTKERNRLAREIHDTVGHTLTGIATGLEACIVLSETNIEKMKVQIVKISELARKGLVEIRRSVSELKLDALERYSLIDAIKKLSEDINECTNTRVNINVLGSVLKMGADEEETVYRIVQEGITNAVRHGNATLINVYLGFKDNVLQVNIIDDGIGCEVIEESFGLEHIKERVNMLGGEAEFIGKPNEGFSIVSYIPIRRRIKND
jgi:signal transduction histidine kinase